MSVPLLTNAATVSGTEKETAVVGDHELSCVSLTVVTVMFHRRVLKKLNLFFFFLITETYSIN